MNAKQKWILAAAGLILLLVIAGFGYQELKEEAQRQELKTLEEKQETYGKGKGEEDKTESTEEEENQQEEKEPVAAPDFTV